MIVFAGPEFFIWRTRVNGPSFQVTRLGVGWVNESMSLEVVLSSFFKPNPPATFFSQVHSNPSPQVNGNSLTPLFRQKAMEQDDPGREHSDTLSPRLKATRRILGRHRKLFPCRPLDNTIGGNCRVPEGSQQ